MHPLALFALVVWLAVLCWQDCRRRVLPNVLTLGGALAALAARYGAGGWGAGNEGLAGGAVCGFFLLLPFLLRATGGGDVKMLFAAGCVVGLRGAASLLFFMSLAGLFVMLVMLACGLADGARLKHGARCLFDWRYDRRAGKAALAPRDSRRYHIPYSLAIAAGTLAAVLWRSA